MPEQMAFLGVMLPSAELIWAAHEAKFKLATETIKIVGAGASLRARGDAVAAADDLLKALREAGVERRFWQFGPVEEMSKRAALRIFGIASRLSRSLENELDEAMWSSK